MRRHHPHAPRQPDQLWTRFAGSALVGDMIRDAKLQLQAISKRCAGHPRPSVRDRMVSCLRVAELALDDARKVLEEARQLERQENAHVTDPRTRRLFGLDD